MNPRRGRDPGSRILVGDRIRGISELPSHGPSAKINRSVEIRQTEPLLAVKSTESNLKIYSIRTRERDRIEYSIEVEMKNRRSKISRSMKSNRGLFRIWEAWINEIR